jgi:radical SAM superfamily enzyme YgiQ (UPF0313 family)
MEFLKRKKNCSVFLFDDDDFPVYSGSDNKWITAFCNELKRRKLDQNIIWKINCRSDEIDEGTFLMMKNHGLFRVFVGIDDGTDTGLARLNKKLTAAQNIDGINVLKRLGINFDYGFLLFQPASTFDSINENIGFLEKLCSDGSVPFKFLKIKPYFGTRVEKELRKEGRLKGKAGFWDYNFMDPSLNNYYSYIERLFGTWLTDQEGMANVSFWAQNYISVFTHFYGSKKEIEPYCSNITAAIAAGNHYISGTLREVADIFESGRYMAEGIKRLERYQKDEAINHAKFKKKIVDAVNSVSHLAEIKTLTRLTCF